MGYKAEGKIEKIFDTEQKTDTFSAREFVIEVSDGQYPQMVKFQLVQDKCELMDDYAEGDQVEVDFDLRGRQWNDKYFTNLQAWKVSRAGESGNGGGSGGQSRQSESAKDLSGGAEGKSAKDDFDTDDIPF